MTMKRPPGRNGPAKPKRSAYDKALGLLARREHSRRELKNKLRQGGYEGEEAHAAIERLGAQQYQDDDRFAEALLRSRIAQGHGPMRLRVELKSHGPHTNECYYWFFRYTIKKKIGRSRKRICNDYKNSRRKSPDNYK